MNKMKKEMRFKKFKKCKRKKKNKSDATRKKKMMRGRKFQNHQFQIAQN